MVVLWVCVGLVLLALLVLAVLASQLLGAFGRLTRELGGLQGDVQPVLAEVQAAVQHAADQRAARTTEPARPPVLGAGDRQVTGG